MRDSHDVRTGAVRDAKSPLRTPTGWLGRDFEQDIHTPSHVCEVVYRCFRGIPDMDPFGSPRQVMRARLIVHPPTDGWVIPWWGKIYLNPEFVVLGRALEHTWRAVHEGNGDEAIVLGPIRTHRNYSPWFWGANACCWMRPIAFEGHTEQFPLPLGLSYYGPHIATFCHFAQVLGRTEPLTPWKKRIMIPPMSDEKPLLAKELEEKTSGVIVELARDNTHRSINEILAGCNLDIGSAEAQVLLSTPLADLVPHQLAKIERAAKKKVSKRDKKPPTNKAAPKRKKKAKAKATPKANGHAADRGAETASKIGKWLSKKKRGDKFKTTDVIKVAGVGRAATIKHLDTFTKIHQEGAGRGAFWVVD